jgi:hypothetical protein
VITEAEIEKILQPGGLEGCARCGSNHDTVIWHRFTNFVYHGDGEIDIGWAMCPTLNEPVLMGWKQSNEEAKPKRHRA